MVYSPNILWMVTTQWRGQAMGFAGDSNARTPHLDQFAGESVNYAQAVTPHPFGPFARAAMLTGQLSPNNGIVDYYDPLPATARTVAHDLAERGYDTAFFGKWHLGQRDPRAALVGESHARQIIPDAQRGGFDFWEGFESGFLLNDPWLHGSRLQIPQRFTGYQSDVLCSRAADFLSDRASKIRPWFAMVSLEAPHPPYDAPSSGVKPADPAKVALRRNVSRKPEVEEKARRELAGYYAHIEATDRAIGRLIGSVQRENTLVVFTSVHGDMHGSHGLFRKGWPHEESVRVPLLIRHPPGYGANSCEDHSAISLADLRKLTLSWVDQQKAHELAPFSLISMPSVVDLPHQCDRAWRGIRSRRRKLILNAEDEPWLFFDLETDPFELSNLVDDPSHAAEIASLRSELEHSTD